MYFIRSLPFDFVSLVSIAEPPHLDGHVVWRAALQLQSRTNGATSPIQPPSRDSSDSGKVPSVIANPDIRDYFISCSIFLLVSQALVCAFKT
ncbi:MAG TPA: hypothetical protein VMU80_24570 [Bryobacteraceae bacterium]|nr:hypothetical protein [Bryobacteraceae bacterium]